MITALFKKRGEAYTGFRVSGHSDYADAGSDIVCAAVSASVMLAVNIIEDGFGEEIRLETDEETALIAVTLKKQSDTGSRIIACLKAELEAVALEHPQNILVKE